MEHLPPLEPKSARQAVDAARDLDLAGPRGVLDAIDRAPVFIGLVRGPRLVYEYANDLYREIVGKPVLVGKPLRDALPELAGQGFFELHEEVLRSGVPYSARQIPISLERGGVLETGYYDFTYQRIPGAPGQADAVLITGSDATQAVLARQGTELTTEATAAHTRLIEARLSEVRQSNETLAMQAEELTAQQEEVEAINEELRKQSEQLFKATVELTTQRQFAERLLANVTGGVAYLDRELVFRFSNAHYARFIGLTPEQVTDRYLDDLLPGAVEQTGPWLHEVMATGTPFEQQNFCLVVHEPAGDRRTYWDFVYYPDEPDTDGRAKGVFVLANEISERLRAERERDEAQQARIAALEAANVHKEQFLGILSHELRTPLNAIEGFGSILEDGLAGQLTPEQTAYVDKILGASSHMLALINDLLDLSRVQAGKFKIAEDEVLLTPLLRQVLDDQASAAAGKRLVLVGQLTGELPLVRGDVQRLRQVVLNLVTNAIKYTDEGGTIAVAASVEGDVVTVRVEDTGIGISPEEQGRVFEPFTQVDMTNTRKVGGVGLGLSIVRALVEAHGGQVGVESTFGVGSTFWFSLPVATSLNDV